MILAPRNGFLGQAPAAASRRLRLAALVVVIFFRAPHSGFPQEVAAPRAALDDEADLAAFEAQVAEARRQVREEALAATRGALASAGQADERVVAQALDAAHENDPIPNAPPGRRILPFADLDRDGFPELLYLRPRSPQPALDEQTEQAHLPAWALLLLSWDGAAWRASSLTEGDGPYEAQALDGRDLRFAAIVFEGADEIPYPAVFRYRNHEAEVAWDSRAPESRYQGYVLGEVEFQLDGKDAEPLFVVTGKADPGAIRFPRESNRGFLARATYRWNGTAYAPERVEFGANADYILYRFLAALRLRDYAGAYAQVDAERFLETQEPTLEMFREHIKSVYPEFLGGHIFEARDTSDSPEEDRSFELERDGKLYVYRPRFGGPPEYRLTGMERREEELKIED
jgi:hypothetical protein